MSVVYANFVTKQIITVDRVDPFERIRAGVEQKLVGYRRNVIADALTYARTWFTRHCTTVDKAVDVGVRQAINQISPFDPTDPPPLAAA